MFLILLNSKTILKVFPYFLILRLDIVIHMSNNGAQVHIFYGQVDFSSEPGVANEILENKPKSCLVL